MSLLSRVTTSASQLPSRVFLYAREKWGKSSLFTHAPNAIYFMTRGETGLVELIAGGRVPPTAHFPYDESDPPTWATLRQAVRELADQDHPYRLLVIDTANGAEILCQEHVRKTQFNGSQSKFASYGKGWDSCRVEWLGLLADLDRLRAVRRMGVVLLAHTQVKKFEDPTADEAYDKYRPACQDKLWDLTHKWSDIIAFGHFQADTYETDSGRTKARSTLRRVLCFDQSPLWEAGNRYGITGQIDVSAGAEAGFKAFSDSVRKARTRPTSATPPSKSPAVQPASSVAPPEPNPEPEPEPEPEHVTSATHTTNTESHPTEYNQPVSTNADTDADTDARPGPAGATEQPPRVGTALAQDLLALCHTLGVTWAEAVARFGPEVGIEPALAAKPFDLVAGKGLAIRDRIKVAIESKKKPRNGKSAGEGVPS